MFGIKAPGESPLEHELVQRSLKASSFGVPKMHTGKMEMQPKFKGATREPHIPHIGSGSGFGQI